MASRLPAEVNFQKFIELAQVFKSSMDLVEDRNPLKRPLLTLGSTTEEGFKYMEESITQLSKENECNSRAVEAIYYRLSRIFGDDPPNNIPSEFKLKTFHRAVAVFEKEKFQFRRKFEDVISTKCGTVKVPVSYIFDFIVNSFKSSQPPDSSLYPELSTVAFIIFSFYKGSVYIISFIMNFSMSNYQIELTTYSLILRKNPVHIDCNFLDFWSRSQLVLPKLVRLARRPFSLVPTSIANERLFSKAGILYGNTLRNRLTRVKAEKLLFLQAMLHSSASRSIRTYNSKCVQLLVDHNDQTADDAYSDEYDISKEL
uniref:Dimer_Tnp_hAT domain-containing protein n=1 Tax=Heterorhabditis bacteriophora TaxID=37862 RepID=A0A1I7WTR3_HETBA